MITIQKYTPEFKEDCISLLNRLWHYEIKKCTEKFEWRYERNPFTKEMFIFLAIDNTNVVGFRAFITQEFSYLEDNRLTLISPADSIIHHDYRRLGILSKLNEEAIKYINNVIPNETKLLMNSSTSANAMPVYLKQNWQKVSALKKYGYRVNIANIFLSKFHPTKIQNEVILKSKMGDVRIGKKPDTDNIVNLISSKAGTSKFTNNRTSSFYEWRFNNLYEDYFFVHLYKNSALKGYLILRALSEKQFIIEEYFVDEPGILKMFSKKSMKYLKIPVLRTIILSKSDISFMKNAGFLIESVKVLRLFGKERFPLLVRPIDSVPAESDFILKGIDIRKIDNWKLFNSDFH